MGEPPLCCIVAKPKELSAVWLKRKSSRLCENTLAVLQRATLILGGQAGRLEGSKPRRMAQRFLASVFAVAEPVSLRTVMTVSNVAFTQSA